MTTKPTCALLLLVGSACSAPPTEQSVDYIEGDRAPAERPEVGFLEWDDIADYKCTGTLVAPSVVITAAHCVAVGYPGRDPNADEVFDDVTARAVPSDLTFRVWNFEDQEGTFYDVDQYVSLRRRAASTATDIALLHLTRPVDIRVSGSPVRPVSLACRRPASDDPRPLVAYGYGATSRYGLDAGSKRKRTIPRETLLASPAGLVSTEGHFTHPGDSGGPLLDADGNLVGVLFGGTGDEGGPYHSTWASTGTLYRTSPPALAQGYQDFAALEIPIVLSNLEWGSVTCVGGGEGPDLPHCEGSSEGCFLTNDGYATLNDTDAVACAMPSHVWNGTTFAGQGGVGRYRCEAGGWIDTTP